MAKNRIITEYDGKRKCVIGKKFYSLNLQNIFDSSIFN